MSTNRLLWHPRDAAEDECWMFRSDEALRWMEQEWELEDGQEVLVDVYSCTDPLVHLPSVERLQDEIVDWLHECGDLTEGPAERYEAAARSAASTLALQHALAIIASQWTGRMADKRVGTEHLRVLRPQPSVVQWRELKIVRADAA